MSKSILPLTRPFYHRHDDDVKDIAHVPRYNAYPPPTEGIFSDCGKVNILWFPHVVGVLEVLLDENLWDGDELTRYWAVQEIYKLIIRMFECGEDMPQLRQNDTNPCLLEQLVNGVWIPAFDFGLCLDKVMPKKSQDALVTAIAENQPIYEEAYQNIITDGLGVAFPDAINSESDPKRATKNDALCITIREYITQIADLWERVANQTPPSDGSVNDFVRNAVNTATSGWSLVTLFAVSASGPAGWLLNLARGAQIVNTVTNGAGTANEGLQLVNDLRTAAFNAGKVPVAIDDDMRNTIICQLYNNLKDKPLTQENFNLAVQAIEGGEGIIDSIRAILQAIFSKNLTYAEFIMIYTQTVAVLDTGANPYPSADCDCEEPPLDCGFDYTFNTYDGSQVPFMTFFEAVPFGAVPTPIPFVPMQDIAPVSPFVINQNVSIYAVSELPCDKPISMTFRRLNTNSAVGKIETFDGTNWVQRASATISVGTVASWVQSVAWANNEGITYQGARVIVSSAAPRIIRFKIGA